MAERGDHGVDGGPQHAASKENMQLMSSPPRLQLPSKERRKPSITPRKFERFFTPRSRVSTRPSAARKALRDMTAGALNRSRNAFSSPLRAHGSAIEVNGSLTEEKRPSKRRKLRQTPESSPIRPSCRITPTPLPLAQPALETGLLSPLDSVPASHRKQRPSILLDDEVLEADADEEDDELPSVLREPPPLIRTMEQRGFAGELAQRMLGNRPTVGRQLLSFPVAGI